MWAVLLSLSDTQERQFAFSWHSQRAILGATLEMNPSAAGGSSGSACSSFPLSLIVFTTIFLSVKQLRLSNCSNRCFLNYTACQPIKESLSGKRQKVAKDGGASNDGTLWWRHRWQCMSYLCQHTFAAFSGHTWSPISDRCSPRVCTSPP